MADNNAIGSLVEPALAGADDHPRAWRHEGGRFTTWVGFRFPTLHRQHVGIDARRILVDERGVTRRQYPGIERVADRDCPPLVEVVVDRWGNACPIVHRHEQYPPE